MSVKALSGKVFLVVTGASRGIGRQIAISFSSKLQGGSHVLLLARNLSALKETAKKIPSILSTDTVSVDLSKATKDELQGIILESLNDKRIETFDRVVVVHNVGTVGDISQTTNEMTDLNIWRNYFDINVFVPAILNGVVMNIFDDSKNTEKVVINITSMFAINPGKTTGYYCTGKAAREMFFKVFALENPQVNVLNYSPGPVDTDMFDTVCKDIRDEKTKEEFTKLKENKTVLTCEQTVNRLLAVLTDCKYTSGDHVDYYDAL